MIWDGLSSAAISLSSLFFHRIISERDPVSGGNPRLPPAQPMAEQRALSLFRRCFSLFCTHIARTDARNLTHSAKHIARHASDRRHRRGGSLIRPHLPVVGAGLGGLRRGESRRSELCHHFVDVTATIADHEPDLQDTAGGPGGNIRNVQVDHHAAGGVGIDGVGAGFLPFRREIGLACRAKTIAPVIALSEPAATVEDLDARRNRWWTVWKTWRGIGGDAKRVFALQRSVRAPEIVAAPAHAAPVSAGKTIAAASIPLEIHVVICHLPWSWNERAESARRHERAC